MRTMVSRTLFYMLSQYVTDLQCQARDRPPLSRRFTTPGPQNLRRASHQVSLTRGHVRAYTACRTSTITSRPVFRPQFPACLAVVTGHRGTRDVR